MSAGVLLVTTAGLMLAGGLAALVAALRGLTLAPSRQSRAGVQSAVSRLSWRHLAAVGAGLAVLLVTGWPVAALGAFAGVVFVPTVLGGAKAAKAEVDRAEALADWTRRLADLILSGSFGSTRQAIRRSLRSVPAPIADQVAALVARMEGPGGIEPALRAFADDVGDPAAEQIAAVLILRERNGGPGLAQVLTERAEDLAEWARMLRDVEAERAKPRANMRTVLGCTAVLLVGAMLFMRTFLSAYSSPGGQVMLAAVIAVFAVSLRWIRNLANPPTSPRILLTPSPIPDGPDYSVVGVGS
jgi:tight adherence protein B